MPHLGINSREINIFSMKRAAALCKFLSSLYYIVEENQNFPGSQEIINHSKHSSKMGKNSRCPYRSKLALIVPVTPKSRHKTKRKVEGLWQVSIPFTVGIIFGSSVFRLRLVSVSATHTAVDKKPHRQRHWEKWDFQYSDNCCHFSHPPPIPYNIPASTTLSPHSSGKHCWQWISLLFYEGNSNNGRKISLLISSPE